MKSNKEPEISDAQLLSPGQQAVKEMVHALPEEALSMAWRSSLNERLIAESAVYARRRRFMWIRMPAAGLAAACALAIAFVFVPGSRPVVGQQVSVNHVRSAGAVEEGLLATYRQESADRALEGAGPDMSTDATKPNVPDLAGVATEWSEVDAENL